MIESSETQRELSGNVTVAAWMATIACLSVCAKKLRRLLSDRTSRWELSDTQFLILCGCRRAMPAGVSQNQLAASLGVSAAQMSGLTEQLQQRELLVSHRASTDRRRQIWQLSTAGEELLDEVIVGLSDLGEHLNQTVPPEDQTHLKHLMQQIGQASNSLAKSTHDTNRRAA